ncbi:glycoside hydrolase family 43 protein [Actinomadura oligospora]|uniref:glycoside hydrolase family 43 protein n=1 Tax=Actinomadura oligospora TaxID=111804 RepID=UPI0004BAF765|nr:glycoside hydrolase family 43 protein [Actinomadura oligospora]
MRKSLIAASAAAVAVAATGTAVWASAGGGHRSSALPAADSVNAAATPRTPTKVMSQGFADPGALKVGRTYYAYGTRGAVRHMPVASAPSARGPWKLNGTDGLPKLGAWANPAKPVWAPDVSRRPDGSYLLYYTAWSNRYRHMCVGAATAKSPAGPFKPVGTGPLECVAPKAARHKGLAPGEIIDPSAFTVGRDHYLLYKVGYNGAKPWKPSFLVIQKMTADGTRKSGAARVILTETSEPYTVEAPYMVKHGSAYVLFYSAGFYGNDTYQTRWATASRPTGPFKKGGVLMSTASLGKKVRGPGGATVMNDGGTWRLFFHGAITLKPLSRTLYTAELGWSGNRPHVR